LTLLLLLLLEYLGPSQLMCGLQLIQQHHMLVLRLLTPAWHRAGAKPTSQKPDQILMCRKHQQYLAVNLKWIDWLLMRQYQRTAAPSQPFSRQHRTHMLARSCR
jgi:hypothetical protein